MAYFYSRKLRLPFDDVIGKITQTLKHQGFGIITTIDVKDTLKQKLDLNFRNYKIFGACNPEYAYKAISLESHIGVLLPCNIVVQEHENGEVEVSAINPMETIDKLSDTTELTQIATEITGRIRAALDELHHEQSGPKPGESLLPDTGHPTPCSVIQG